ncbi:hypothetical protein ACFB49_29850 [Sphingomonas sp. DBB INV C78]|uniref:hypothetical protein n=1 Tax=Sphingomonas sp. DBB INV C78 TaxID=3349434 RepID=UPI0036D2EC0F
MGPAGTHAELDRYIGYRDLYPTSHQALDAALQWQVRNVALTLVEALRARCAGRMKQAGCNVPEPRLE